MEDSFVLGEDLPLPPARLFERLSLLPGYTWDQSAEPIHSTYDNWHVFGSRLYVESEESTPTPLFPTSAARDSPKIERPAFRHRWRSSSSESSSDLSAPRVEAEPIWKPVVARVSTHVVRLEREYHMMRSIIQLSDPDCLHTVRPIDLVRLPPEPDDPGPILVSIFESPGPNYLKEMVSFGPAWFEFGARGETSSSTSPSEQVPLTMFFDFAIGACDCLELLHYGLKTIHGEIRGDAFHFNRETGAVKLINTGNGARAFDNALGEGWSALSREVGVKMKLQFIAPEQTGRMPIEPDSRTDIYALGVLFWIMLVGKPAFPGNTPVEVVQNVLGKQLPPVSAKRMDVPDALSAVILKMTRKQLNERYHTITSVKRDLEQISKLLGDGDSKALETFEVAKHDVSSFFTLPTEMYGRQDEYNRIISVVDKVYRRQHASHAKSAATQTSGNGLHMGSVSSISEGRIESFELGDGSEDSGSFVLTNSRGNLNTGFPHHQSHAPTHDSNPSKPRLTADSRPLSDNADRDSHLSTNASAQSPLGSTNSASRHKTGAKLRRSGRCEIITISGSAGIGKSDMLQRIQPVVRRLGYFGSARMDRARRIPFEPLAKILASLLRQIFSERDVTSDYHNSIRSLLKPHWPTLQVGLGLPEQLICFGQNLNEKEPSPPMSVAQHLLKEGSKGEHSKRPSMAHQPAVDLSLPGAPNRQTRVMETYIELLRHLASHKFICICLDDLQYADDETALAITNIIKSNVPCLLILTARKNEIVSPDLQALFETEAPNFTGIELQPLKEDDVVEFVAATMHQPPSSALLPLAAVILERSRGNPFYVRMMLETCYRKNCIWYSWRHSRWEFDLDRVFTEFISNDYGDTLGIEFITKRFQEIPEEARAILIWASFLGSPFSFSLVQKLLKTKVPASCEDICEDNQEVEKDSQSTSVPIPNSDAAVVASLQFLVQSYIILPGETDDEFRFAHDRFAQAIASMRECSQAERMHFIIAQTMMKYCDAEEDLYAKAQHICHAHDIIRCRVKSRSSYRRVLMDAAAMAVETGARRTALWFFRTCLGFLQPNCWEDHVPDVDYEETLRLHVTAAEAMLSQGEDDEALGLLSEVLTHARSPCDKSKAWILKSRIHSQKGDNNRAMENLLTCLEELGVQLRSPTSYAQCDASFAELSQYLRSINFESVIQEPVSQDRSIISIGSVLAEAMAVSFWWDDLTFLHMTLEAIKLHIFRGRFSQIGLGCSHLAMVAYSRYMDLELAARMSDLALLLFETYSDSWSRGAGLTIHMTIVEHLRVPIRTAMPALSKAIESSFASADPHLMLLSYAAMALSRLFLGQDLSELEIFCTDTPEELGDWVHDPRGGVLLLAVRQVARALQGKTAYRSADLIMCDNQHNTADFMGHVDKCATRAERPRDIYWGLAMIPLFVYGHYDKAIEVGMNMMDSIKRLWSMRVSYVTYFYLALSILTKHLSSPGTIDIESQLDLIKKYKAEIDFARDACNANYGMWSLLLDALLYEVEGKFGAAVQAYEVGD